VGREASQVDAATVATRSSGSPNGAVQSDIPTILREASPLLMAHSRHAKVRAEVTPVQVGGGRVLLGCGDKD
jgi:hypothetical protein